MSLRALFGPEDLAQPRLIEFEMAFPAAIIFASQKGLIVRFSTELPRRDAFKASTTLLCIGSFDGLLLGPAEVLDGTGPLGSWYSTPRRWAVGAKVALLSESNNSWSAADL